MTRPWSEVRPVLPPEREAIIARLVKYIVDDAELTARLNLQQCSTDHERIFAPHSSACDMCESGYPCGFGRFPCNECAAAI